MSPDVGVEASKESIVCDASTKIQDKGGKLMISEKTTILLMLSLRSCSC